MEKDFGREQITWRRMRFDFEARGFEKRWHGGKAFVSYFWNALSASFPPGERFFVAAARSMCGSIEDPTFVSELNEFVRQEGQHSLQHRKFNLLVGAQGFDIARYERRFETPLRAATLKLSPLYRLAVTVALEHFTAVFARQGLKNPRLTEGADPAVLALWSWHFAEELEHKSTCFDLYHRMGGTYRTRMKAAREAWLMIIGFSIEGALAMMKEDESLWDARELARGLWYLLGPGGFLTSMMPGLGAFLRPGFDPRDVDDTPLIEAWKAGSSRYLVRQRDADEHLAT